MELKDRKRSIDINKLTIEQAEEISQQVGEKVRFICDDAVEKMNRILNIYGMKAKIAIAFEPLVSEVTENNLNETKQGS